ncbi:hypothetical protein, conserved [Leishmania lindenbergi]|uniref:Uncharacterized protein n=1 Tax=Leishmania lindenbergi TaxID=651832 RepID=A0AAW3A3E4_9TRYP
MRVGCANWQNRGATEMPNSGDPDSTSRPETTMSPNMNATKAVVSASGAQTAHPAVAATTKGSRRAQGWHSAVTGGAPPRTTSANRPASDTKSLGGSAAHSGIVRRSSVQFSKDSLVSQNSSRTPRDEASEFRQNMADFLMVMYGDKTASGVVGADEKDGAPHAKGKAGPGESRIPGALLEAGREPPWRAGSSRSVSSRSKGPLVKGLTANSGRNPQVDRIDTLVESLVRAYSRRTTSARGEFQGIPGVDDDNPITYNGPHPSSCRRALTSPRLSHGNSIGTGSGHTDEVSAFVGQALDNILNPGGILGQGAVSNLSMLSSLRLDRNLFDLMPFQTQSNLQNVITEEEDSGTMLKPMYVGEQAMFRSVGTRPSITDISVSKSMRGMIPAAPPESGKGHYLNTTQAPLSGDSGGPPRSSGGPSLCPPKQTLGDKKRSLDSEVMENAFVNQRGSGALGGDAKNKSIVHCMSLDSKVLGRAVGADDEDDSWGDEPAGILATKAKDSGSSGIDSSARSLLDYSRARANVTLQKALGTLQVEEQLKRDVVIAVEHQLCGYITSLEHEERLKKSGGSAASSGQKKRGGETSASSTPAAGSSMITDGVIGAGTNTRSRGTVNSDTAPLMQNIIDFFQENTTEVHHSNTLASAAAKT